MHTLRRLPLTAAMIAFLSTAVYAQTTTAPGGTSASLAEQPAFARNAVRSAPGRAPGTWVEGGISAYTVRQTMMLDQFGGGSPVTQPTPLRDAIILNIIQSVFPKLSQLIQDIFGVTITPPGTGLAAAPTATTPTSAGLTTLTANASGGTPPYTYSWTAEPTTTFTAQTGATTNATITKTTTFTVTVTDSSTPQNTATGTVTVTIGTTTSDTLSVIASGTTAANTAGGTKVALKAAITGGTNPTVVWTAVPTPTSISSTTDLEPTAVITTNTVFVATVTDASTPRKTAKSTVNVPVVVNAITSQPLSISVVASATPASVTTSTAVTLTAATSGISATTVTWTANPPTTLITPIPGSTNATATVAATTTFTVTVLDSASVEVASASVTVPLTTP